MRLSFGGMLSVLLWAALAQAATLEIPAPNAIQSGIGIISGWKCRANGHLTIRIDGGGPFPLLYGSARVDTRSVCGDANNGFVATFNYALLGAGRHTAIVYDNGVEFDRATFTVVTTGVEFLRGVTGSGTATLSNGQSATLQWSEAVQGFVPTDFTPPSTRPVSGLSQFLGTWRFTNQLITRTYRFPRVEACRGDASDRCIYADGQNAGLIATTGTDYGYILLDISGICRMSFLYEPRGSTVQGHYGFAAGSCTADSTLRTIASMVASRRYPTTGTRLSQSASQVFSLEAEERTAEDVAPEEEEIRLAIEEMLFVIAD